MRDDRERLLDIQEAIARIEKYAARGREAFEADELVQTWILHYLQIIGEAARELTTDLRARSPELPWSKIVGMRHVLVHRYFEIDADIVWSVLEDELPALKRGIEALLASLGK